MVDIFLGANDPLPHFEQVGYAIYRTNNDAGVWEAGALSQQPSDGRRWLQVRDGELQRATVDGFEPTIVHSLPHHAYGGDSPLDELISGLRTVGQLEGAEQVIAAPGTDAILVHRNRLMYPVTDQIKPGTSADFEGNYLVKGTGHHIDILVQLR